MINKNWKRSLTNLLLFCPDCITTVASYDPDIEDRTADQHIAYFIIKEDQQPFITINKNGCMKLKKPLDRDLPNGYPMWNVS